MALLEIKNVDYAYPSGDSDYVQALYSVSLAVERGEFVALVGCNGSGKSTLARLANGLIVPDRGDVLVDGMSTSQKDKLFDIRKRIGVVFQNPDNQMVTTIVEDDIAFGPENLGLPPKEIRERVDFALSCVGMSEYAESSPFRLSGGQKQRIAIAGVLAIKPDLMILDEATGMLDPDGRAEVMKVVTKLNREEHVAVVMITHFMEEAAAADRIIILDHGHVVADGGRELFKTPEVFTRAGLDLPLSVRAAGKLAGRGFDIGCPLDTSSFVDAVANKLPAPATDVGAEKTDSGEKVGEKNDSVEKHDSKKTTIEVDKLSYVYSPKTPFTKQALFDVDLDIREGDFFGIIGSTGAGKSTLVSHFNALTRVQKRSGTVIVEGMDLSTKKIDLPRLRATVGMVFQYPEHQLFDETVEKDVRFGPKNIGLSADEQAERAKQAIELVGLDYETMKDRSPFELSGGQKRRVALAGVLAMRPDILVLDEPTAGLDPRSKRDILDLILRVKHECPTIVMISHNMDEVAEYCNRIAVMNAGRIVGVFTPRELFGNKKLLDASGVKLPLVTETAYRLNAAGVAVPADVLTESELVAAILRAAGKPTGAENEMTKNEEAATDGKSGAVKEAGGENA